MPANRRACPSCVLAVAFSVASFAGALRSVAAQETAEQKLVVSIDRIWDRAEHSAFTDIAKFRDRYWCTFREGTGHVPGINGTVRVIVSDDLRDWRTAAVLDEPHVDLRDPKLSVTPEGRLLVVMGGSFYEGKKRLGMESRVSFSDAEGRNFTAPRKVVVDEKVRTPHDWLWRITWHKGQAWGAVQQIPPEGERTLQLVRSDDAVTWRHVATLKVPAPSETTLRFLPDETLVAMTRDAVKEAGDRIGISRPPYTEWTWKQADRSFGGPNFVQLPDGGFLAGTRSASADGKAQMELFRLHPAEARMESLLVLPSGGDCSYPGFVVEPERNRVLVSYYSGHTGRTSIHLAVLRLDALSNAAK